MDRTFLCQLRHSPRALWLGACQRDRGDVQLVAERLSRRWAPRILVTKSAESGRTVIATNHEELRQKWRGYLANDDRLRAVATYTRQRFDAEKRLTAHNWEHIYRDTLNAIVIGDAEGADMSVAAIIADMIVKPF